MRYASGHKEKTRAKIVKAAGKVFRREGYHAAGVDEVMEEAGLTAGGFYAHFESKEALLAATLEPTSVEVVNRRENELEGVASHAWLEAFIECYLAPRHMTNTEEGCPLPALVSEVARAGGPVKASFEAVVRGFAARLMEGAGAKLTEERALAIVALCVGGLGVARSVKDDAFGERILASCRELARASLAATPQTEAPAKPRRRKGK
jgi:TetR/AcrR family transcriptional regulator, transcriptional repressor for nem operon